MMAVIPEEKTAQIERAFAVSGIALTRVGRMTAEPYIADDVHEAHEAHEAHEELWGLLKRGRS